MQISWPDNLIEEVANRRAILFLGAGISATAKNEDDQSPKRWKEFLEDALGLLNDPPQEKVDFIHRMIAQNNYLLALQAIHDACDPGQYARYIRSVYSRPNYQASNVHKLIKEIDCKVVITTNFDKIYENLCNDHGYTVAHYSESQKILSNIKSTENLIIKAHGSVDDIDNIVFTQRQYYEAKKNYSQFYDILNALFLTHTVIFLGYSMNDPDINLILEAVANTSSPSSPNYVIQKQGLDQEMKQYWRDCYNIVALEYGPEYENLEENIAELSDQVLRYRQKWSIL